MNRDSWNDHENRTRRLWVILVGALVCVAACFGIGALGVEALGELPSLLRTADAAQPTSPEGEAPGFDTSTDLSEQGVEEMDEGMPLSFDNGGDSGLTLYDATNAMTAWDNFKSTRCGAYVLESKYEPGFRYGDYLLSVNGQRVSSVAEAKRAFAACAVGECVTVEVIRVHVQTRGGRPIVTEKTITMEMILRERAPEDAAVRFDMHP